jgi:flagellar hook protein FlgE
MALIGSLNSGISALRNFARGLEVIGNNIANVNSTAYKGSRTKYTDSFSQFLTQPATSPADGNGSNAPASQVGLGVRIAGVQTSFLQGGLTTTGQGTDLAISGNGFFQVQDARSGRLYATRAGDMRTDDRGFITTNDGYRLQGLTGGYTTYDATVVNGQLQFTQTIVPAASVGAMQIDFDPTFDGTTLGRLTNNTGGLFTDTEVYQQAPRMVSFAFNPNGDLNVRFTNGDEFVAGRVLLMDFRDPTALVREGANLFSGFEAAGVIGSAQMSVSDNTPGSYGLGSIQGGTLEQSNVDLTEEFANMITTQRSFQAGSRIITVSDDILQEVVNLKR